MRALNNKKISNTRLNIFLAENNISQSMTSALDNK